MEKEVEGELPKGWYPVSPDQSPSPTIRLLSKTCGVSPFVFLPFSNLRMQSEYPGFSCEQGEKRFGEHPLRPTTIDIERRKQWEEESSRQKLIGKQEIVCDSREG